MTIHFQVFSLAWGIQSAGIPAVILGCIVDGGACPAECGCPGGAYIGPLAYPGGGKSSCMLGPEKLGAGMESTTVLVDCAWQPASVRKAAIRIEKYRVAIHGSWAKRVSRSKGLCESAARRGFAESIAAPG